MQRQYLKRLMKVTNEALRRAAEDKTRFDGDPINWGDLSCVDAEYCEGFVEEDFYYRVYVEEVDPAAQKLRQYLDAALLKAGHSNTRVDLSW